MLNLNDLSILCSLNRLEKGFCRERGLMFVAHWNYVGGSENMIRLHGVDILKWMRCYDEYAAAA